MNIQVVTVLIVTFVTRLEAAINEAQNQISPRISSCVAFPSTTCADCSSQLICHDEDQPPLYLPCPTTKPYCQNGKCGKVQGSCTVPSTQSTFKCTSDGIFPDPTDCSRWYICAGDTATLRTCASGLIFNSKLNICERGFPKVDHAYRKICQRISCRTVGTIVFPANPAYFATCTLIGGVLTLTMHKCPYPDHEVFDIGSDQCIFNCKSGGVFPDPLNCTGYYVCSRWSTIKPVHAFCDSGAFNASETRCTDYTESCPPYTDTVTPPTSPTPGPEEPGIDPNPDPDSPPIDPDIPPIDSEAMDQSLDSHQIDTLYQIFGQMTTTTKRPIFPYFSLWKHKGKYSIRLGKLL